MYRRNLKAIIVAFVLVSGFGIGTAAHASAAPALASSTTQAQSVNQNVAAGTKVVTGTVTDPSGETLIGLTVKVVGTNVVVATDIDGNYSIKVPAGSNELEFSYIGYETIKRAINGQSKIDVVMDSNDKLLDEVVVTAMGITRKESSLTYATQEIKGDELMKVQDANFVNSLQGKAAGVTITQSAGGAGGTSKILLRGNKSVMGNNSPLIVVDGIPMTNQIGGAASAWSSDGNSLTYSSTAEGGDALSLINPDDIESINILKGANAAALYGSAAANGVLMITTKRGKEGSVTVSVNSNVTFETPLVLPQIQNTYGADVNVAANQLSTTSWGKKVSDMTADELAYSGAHLRNYTQNDIADFFETGATYNNSVSISGGTEKVRSYFSYANSYSDGMVPNNSYQRNTFSFRQNYSLFNKKLNVDLSLNYVHANTKNRPGGGTVMNPLYDLYRMPRNIDMDYYRKNYRGEGTWTSNIYGYYNDKREWIPNGTTQLSGPMQQWAYFSAGNNNPYWITGMNRSENTEERAYGYISASYEIIPGLKVQGRLNMDRAKYKGYTNRYATTWNVATMEDYGMYGQDLYWSNDVYVDAMLSYNKQIKDFSVSATAGWVGHTVKGETQKMWNRASYFSYTSMNELPTRINFFEPTASWGAGSVTTYSLSSNWDKGLFFTGQVGYKDYVYLEGSYRQDWYRAFKQFEYRGTPDNYGYFSVGANTLMHKYITMPEFITHLKLRASYSEVGNSIPNEVFSMGSENLATGAIASSTYGYFDNPLPETSKSFEAGFDVSLFESALNWDLTYYHTQLCNSYFLQTTTGGKMKPVNTGLIRNQGVETTLSYSLNFSKDWMWRTSVNFSYNDNKIVKTFKDDQGNPAKLEQKIAGGNIVVRYDEGGSYGDMYALDFRRNADGSIWLSSEGAPQVSTTDFVYLGNMNSKFQLGWGNTFTWKDLSLYFLINGRIGGKVISLTEAYLDYQGVSKRVGDARDYAAAHNLVWTSPDGSVTKPGMIMPDGNVAPIQEYYQTVGGNYMGSQYVYDATNFRLAELSLGYTFRNLFGGVIRNLSLSVIGRNLFFIYKDAPIDPNIALSTKNGLGAFDIFNMPATRSFGVNLKIDF